MSRIGWLVKDQDLLRQRRLERGLAPEVQVLISAQSLLLRGVAIALVPVALVSGIWLWLWWRHAQISRQLDGLQGIPIQLQSLESFALKRRGEFSAIQRSNEGLAKGLVAVSSGSALLAEMAALTPQGVQLTDLQVQAGSLSLKGLANDPQAFRRINGLSLLLARSPFIQPSSVKVIKLSRDQPTATPGQTNAVVAPVSWDLNAAFAALPAARQLTVLRKLGATGMARRLEILQREGVLP